MEIKINIDTKEVLNVLENIQDELESLKNMKIETEKDNCNNKSKMNITIDAPIVGERDFNLDLPIEHKKNGSRTIGDIINITVSPDNELDYYDEIANEICKKLYKALNEELNEE